MALDATLARAWKRGGNRATGVEGDDELRVEEGARIEGLVLEPGETGELEIVFERTSATPGRLARQTVGLSLLGSQEPGERVSTYRVRGREI